MDLLEHTKAHMDDLKAAKSIEDGDTRSREIFGWQQHVAIECSCTAYRYQLKNPELLNLLDEIGVLDILKSWWGDDFAA